MVSAGLDLCKVRHSRAQTHLWVPPAPPHRNLLVYSLTVTLVEERRGSWWGQHVGVSMGVYSNVSGKIALFG